MRFVSYVTVLCCALVASSAVALDKVTLATHWKAEAEHGGFYQAIADGTYAEHGLEVQILQGGPLVNHRLRLAIGRVDFLLGSNLIQAFDAVRADVPTVVIAGFFQKDVRCLIAHPDSPYETWSDLKDARLLVSNSGRQTFLRWLVAEHGFKAENTRPYTFNLAPFLTNPKVVVQGLTTAEPKAIQDALDREPRVFPLSDHGWQTYSTTLETHTDLVRDRPEVVQRFVDASILGWQAYLEGDPSAAHELIQKDNPDMSDSQLAFSRQRLIDDEVVLSGDANTLGIGALSADRIQAFYDQMVEAGLYEPGQVDPEKTYTLQFVNRGTGLKD